MRPRSRWPLLHGSRLPPNLILDFTRALASFCDEPFLVGTVCSGCDIIVRVIQVMIEATKNMFGISFDLVHAFAAEIDEKNCAF